MDKENNLFGFLYEPKRVDFFDDYFVDDVSFGLDFALAIVRKRIKEDQNSEEYKVGDETMLFSWGYNQHGQCGSGDYANSLTPRKVQGLDGYKIDLISAGQQHSLILASKDNKSTLFSWGDSSKGATGLTKSLAGSFPSPTAITILEKSRKVNSSDSQLPIIYISAGINTSFAIIG